MSINRSPAALAQRFVWKFYHRGDEGQYTKAFSCFDGAIQAHLLQLAEASEGEVPAIAAYLDEANWMLLTSRQVSWAEAGVKSTVGLLEIEQVDAEFLEVAQAKLPHLDRFKDTPPRLFLVTRQASKKELPCEPRGPFFGLLNVLDLVAGMNRPRRMGATIE
jgi:hypothetical protein